MYSTEHGPSASYTLNPNVAIDRAEVEDLFEKANSLTTDGVYSSKPDAAEFFTYTLTVHHSSGLKTVEWVDESAMEKTMPEDLREFQTQMENVIDRVLLKVRGPMEEPKERAVKTARDFITGAPTFRFDGIPESLEVVDVVERESFASHWHLYDVIIDFESRHPGYGDRSGEVLPQVITPHRAVVAVKVDKVGVGWEAIIDDYWDEVRQQPSR